MNHVALPTPHLRACGEKGPHLPKAWGKHPTQLFPRAFLRGKEIWRAAAIVFLNLFALTPLWNITWSARFFICREKINPEAYSNFLLVESCAWFVSTKPGFLGITWLTIEPALPCGCNRVQQKLSALPDT